MRGGMPVGIITRANYPNKRIACGFYTCWAPVTVRGEAQPLPPPTNRPSNAPRETPAPRTPRK
jgi:hypothetical protein